MSNGRPQFVQLLHLVRYKNLLIIFLTQLIFRYIGLRDVFAHANIEAQMPIFHFILLSISTTLVAAGGNIINDIYDQSIDQINKPNKSIVGRYITERQAFQLYFLTIFIGFLLSSYLAYAHQEYPLLLLYPASVFLLWLYSYALKCRLLIGNIVVSLFIAFVTLLVWIAERKSILQLKEIDMTAYENIISFFVGFSILAFFSNFIRELIKDMEDVEGDASAGCRTLPIVVGISKSQKITMIIIAFFLAIFLIIIALYQSITPMKAVLSMSIVVGFSYIFIKLSGRELSKEEFSSLSDFAKWMMITALCFILVQ